MRRGWGAIVVVLSTFTAACGGDAKQAATTTRMAANAA